jgi:hypothetical protein
MVDATKASTSGLTDQEVVARSSASLDDIVARRAQKRDAAIQRAKAVVSGQADKARDRVSMSR